MTFDITKWAQLDSGFSGENQRIWGYISSTDAIATIVASAYFNNVAGLLRQYDIIFIQASDDVNIYQVSSASGAIPVTLVSIIDTSSIPDNSITTAKIVDANITLAKLAVGITPSHVVRFAGKHSYAGGGTSDAATVTGVVAGDIVLATIEASTNTTYIGKAVSTTDTVTFTFGADPGAATIVSYIVLNAAS